MLRIFLTSLDETVKRLLLKRKKEILHDPNLLEKIRYRMLQGLDKRKLHTNTEVINLEKLLKNHNAWELIPGWLIRSSHLGAANLAKLNLALVQKYGRSIESVANLSFFGYNPLWQDNGYALEEFDFCQRNGMTFLHPFSRDISKRIFWDSFNPAKSQPDRDVFFQSTIDSYLAPEAKEKFGLKLSNDGRSYGFFSEEASLTGETEEVQKALLRMINSPWPWGPGKFRFLSSRQKPANK